MEILSKSENNTQIILNWNFLLNISKRWCNLKWHHSGRPPSLCAGRSMMLSITRSLCLASSITQRKITLESWMGHGAVAGLTWLCYMITQPVGCPPVKCLPALMNGCNMSRITTRHATHSLMASHNARDVPPMDSQGEREREKEVVVVLREWEMAFMNTPTLFPCRHSRR